jgi:hypothetical protein
MIDRKASESFSNPSTVILAVPNRPPEQDENRDLAVMMLHAVEELVDERPPATSLSSCRASRWTSDVVGKQLFEMQWSSW